MHAEKLGAQEKRTRVARGLIVARLSICHLRLHAIALSNRY